MNKHIGSKLSDFMKEIIDEAKAESIDAVEQLHVFQNFFKQEINKMKQISKQTIQLSDDDLKEAVSLFLNKKMSLPDDTVWKVSVGTSTECQGYGVNARDVTVVDISAERNL